MVNQWEFEVFSYHHKQKLQREAEASRLLKGIKEKIPNSDSRSGSIITWLIEQLTGHEVRRQEDYREAMNGERSLISG